MKYLVIAPSVDQFQATFRNTFPLHDVEKINFTSNQALLKNGDVYQFVNQKEQLRGIRGAKVLYWGGWTPAWAFDAQDYIRECERQF